MHNDIVLWSQMLDGDGQVKSRSDREVQSLVDGEIKSGLFEANGEVKFGSLNEVSKSRLLGGDEGVWSRLLKVVRS